jgi:hypothetical protein
MAWTEKIDNKKYVIGSIINIGFALYGGRENYVFALSLSYIVIASILNHVFMVTAFVKLIKAMKNEDTDSSGKRNRKIMVLLIGKVLILISAFVVLLKYAEPVILHGMLCYVFQLIILGLSIKNMETFFKKGPSK